MTISKETMEQKIQLAKLDYPAEKLELLIKEMQGIVDLVAILDELDTSDVTPTYHGINLESVMRDDEAVNELDRQALLDNAPAQKDGLIQVPNVMSDEGGQA